MYANYQLTRGFLFWHWEADFRGQATSSGKALTKAGARRGARLWVRNRLAAAAPPTSMSLAEPIRLAA